MAEKPNRLCSRCGSNDWWLRDSEHGPAEWLCNRCHPNPKEKDAADSVPIPARDR